ncbi:hypothetical protein y223_00018 [Bordetella phage PY223]
MNYEIPTLYRKGVRMIGDDKMAVVFPSLYAQQRVGRICRPIKPAPIILDYDARPRHVPQDREWTLDRPIKPGDMPASLRRIHEAEDRKGNGVLWWIAGGAAFVALSILSAAMA